MPVSFTGVQGSTPTGPNIYSNAGMTNPLAGYLAQFMPYLTKPSAYGSVPNIPATSTNTTTSSWAPNLPNYAGLAGQASDLASTWMKGQLSPDVIANMATAGAERGVAMGSPGSPNANAAYLRALGLSSQGLQQQGLQDYESLLAGAPRTTTSTQTIDNNVLKALYAAAPNPMDAALANLAAEYLGLQAGAGTQGGTGGGGYTITPGAGGGINTNAPLPPDTRSGGPYSGTGPFSPPPGTPTNASLGLPSGLSYGLNPQPPSFSAAGFSGTTMDQQGNEWVQLSNGEWMNLTTGQTEGNPPGYGTTVGGTTYAPGSPMDMVFGGGGGGEPGQDQPFYIGDGMYYDPVSGQMTGGGGEVGGGGEGYTGGDLGLEGDYAWLYGG